MEPAGRIRTLSAASLTAAVAGETIGIGIFLTPADMVRSLGSPFWVLCTWLFVGGLTLCGALSYGRLASRFPESGGIYVYLREAYGPRIAFLYGWMSLLVIDPGLTAAWAIGLAGYASSVIPLSALARHVVAVGALLAIASLNLLHASLGVSFLRYVTWLKLGLLGVLTLWPMIFRLGDWSHLALTTARPDGAPPLSTALAGAVLVAFISFGGWWDASKLVGQVGASERVQRRAMLLGVLLVTLVYLAISTAFLYVIPSRQVSQDAFVSQFGAALFGPLGARAMAGIVCLCLVSSLAAYMATAPHVYCAMARDGLFFASLGRLHPRFQTPARALLLEAALACVLVFTGTFEEVLAYFVPAAIVFLGLSVASLLRWPHAQRRGQLLAPVLFLLFVGAMLLLLVSVSPRRSLLGMAIVAVGLVLARPSAFRRRG
ncbi:MAG TPA: amino acid permease [Polyangia bacterium]|nr:amino acid permease [Polyangia bacterium]